MATRPALHTRICDLLGVRYPIVQTGMGWVSGAQLTAATMTQGELEAAIRAVRERTDRPFGVNMRADQPDVAQTADLVIRHGVKLASFAGPPKRELITRLKDGGVLTMPTIGAPRHAT